MTLQEQVEALLEDIRSALSITWDDAETDRQLRGILARGISYLNDIAGGETDFTQEGKGKELLIAYCLYARSNALDQFQTNYLPDLSYFQASEEVKRYLAEKNSIAGVP